MGTLKVQPLRWEDIEKLKEGDPLYVINASDMERKQSRGEVHLPVRDGDEEQAIPIPNTWIPINLVEYTTLTALKASQQLRTLLRGKVLVAISAELAKELYSRPDAQEELSRVQKYMAENSKLGFGIGESTVAIDTTSSAKITDGDGPTRPTSGAGEADSTVAQGIVGEYNTGGSEDELIDRLEREYSRGNITTGDINRAMDELLNKGSRLFLKLADLRSGDDAGMSGDRVVRAM